MIPSALASRFSAAVRARGEHYFARGRVRLTRASDSGITATVRGAQRYSVTIGLDADLQAVSLSCTCPYFADFDACKRLWATLRAAEEESDLWLFEDSQSRPQATANGEDWSPPLRQQRRKVQTPKAHRERVPGWRKQLDALMQPSRGTEFPARAEPWPKDRRITYRLDIDSPSLGGELTIEVCTERIDSEGKRGGRFSFSRQMWRAAPDADDREVAEMLLGAGGDAMPYHPGDPDQRKQRWRFAVPDDALRTTLRRIVRTGRCRLESKAAPHLSGTAVHLDEGEPWHLRLRIASTPTTSEWRIDPVLVRETEETSMREVVLLGGGSVAVIRDRLAFVDLRSHWPLLLVLLRGAPISVPRENLFDLASALAALPNAPPVDLPAGTRIEELRSDPRPRLLVKRASKGRWLDDGLVATLEFAYGDAIVPFGKPTPRRAFSERRLLVRRPDLEHAAYDRLLSLGAGVRHDWITYTPQLAIPVGALDTLVGAVTAEGWDVQVEGVQYHTVDALSANVRSGVDWFDLEGFAAFGDQRVAFPELIAALRRGERTITLPDGSRGVLPADWLRRHAPLLDLGTASRKASAIRFTRSQVLLLNELLATIPESRADKVFEQARSELRSFDGIPPADPPPGFAGTLRPYQRDGLGWLHFLRRFGLGGCLADDMGLGKTVQVLSLLESRRAEGAGPALAVVPRSLVFNWKAEAARFAPSLRVLDFTGTERHRVDLSSGTFDLALTTYGTLRRDAARLRDVEFDYVILDEAQAIKNAETASAKAARLVRGRHRLALTGTPIENRVSDLWSLCEFLNPGVLGTRKAFASLQGDDTRAGDTSDRALLARALRPLILRRRKEEVAADLPPRTEQTLVVELEREQRRLYDELRNYYRADLLGRVDRDGIKAARMHVLEALLRLRQAACHPGRLDRSRVDASSAKLDALLPQLLEVAAEGHKALVFSQFTSFLEIVERAVRGAGISYEYLDGRTIDREARVARFQNDDGCQAFLISLRAGGQGLNLTAADYVFLLDPWWNPAVEAQAIDRAHRMAPTGLASYLGGISVRNPGQSTLHHERREDTPCCRRASPTGFPPSSANVARLASRMGGSRSDSSPMRRSPPR